MKTVWGLVLMHSVALVLTPLSCGSADMNESTTTWGRSSTEEADKDDLTFVSTSSGVGGNNTRGYDTTTTTKPSPRLPVYRTGRLSASEFKFIGKIQSWLFLAVEPIAIMLMVLSAVAFLQDRQFASNCYLAAICLFEAWYLLTFFIYYSCRQRAECFTSRTYVQVSIWSISYTGMAARRCVYVLNGFTSFQRFLAIAFPLKVQKYRLLQKPRAPLTAVILSCFALHLYRPLQYTPVLMKGGDGDSWTQGFSSSFRRHREVFLALADVGRYLMMYTPILLCLVCNSLMILALKRHNEHLSTVNKTNSGKEHEASKSKTERQMTITILASTFLMLFFNTPANINEAVSMYSHSYGLLKQDHYLYIVLRGTFSLISQVSNFLIALSYFVLSTAFRRRFLALFRPVRHLVRCRRSAAHTASDTSGPATAAVTSITTTTSTSLTHTSGTEE